MYPLKCIIALSFVAVVARARGTPRILNGHDAPSGKYPYVVSIRYSTPPYSHFCGGTIVNERYILTAAQCLENRNTTTYTISAGTNYLNETGTVYKPAFAIIHEAPRFGVGLIGLIRTTDKIVFNEFVKPVKLRQINETDHGGFMVTFVGWGLSNTTGNSGMMNILQEITYETRDCRPWGWSPEMHICISAGAGCVGDEGGPVVIDGIQIGLGSTRLMCWPGHFPDVFNRIYYHRAWIDDILNSTFILPPNVLNP